MFKLIMMVMVIMMIKVIMMIMMIMTIKVTMMFKLIMMVMLIMMFKLIMMVKMIQQSPACGRSPQSSSPDKFKETKTGFKIENFLLI